MFIVLKDWKFKTSPTSGYGTPVSLKILLTQRTIFMLVKTTHFFSQTEWKLRRENISFLPFTFDCIFLLHLPVLLLLLLSLTPEFD